MSDDNDPKAATAALKAEIAETRALLNEYLKRVGGGSSSAPAAAPAVAAPPVKVDPAIGIPLDQWKAMTPAEQRQHWENREAGRGNRNPFVARRQAQAAASASGAAPDPLVRAAVNSASVNGIPTELWRSMTAEEKRAAYQAERRAKGGDYNPFALRKRGR